MSTQTPIIVLECESREPDLSSRRSCTLLGRLIAPDRDDYWLAKVDPPFLGQHFGLGATEISDVVVATRLRGLSLFDQERPDVPVYVARILDHNVITSRTVQPNQIELILWCYAKQIENK